MLNAICFWSEDSPVDKLVASPTAQAARGLGQPPAKGRVPCRAVGCGKNIRRDPPLYEVCTDCGESHHARHYRGVFGGDTDWVCPKCVARDDPSPSVPGEMLLGEDTDPTPPSRAPASRAPASRALASRSPAKRTPDSRALPPLPSFRDAALEFDAKMDEYGLERSPSQRDTEPDGNCAVYGNI